MGHRALVAYEQSDSTYNIHYSHWGANELQLKHALTPRTPYGADEPSTRARNMHQALTDGVTPEAVADKHGHGHEAQVDPLPLETAVTLEAILTKHLDYLQHEALYVVDRTFEVTAYRTLWFGFQYESDRVDDAPTVGYGAVRTVRWCDGEPVGDPVLRGQFTGMKRTLGAMIDRDRIDEAMATQFLRSELTAMTDQGFELRFGALE